PRWRRQACHAHAAPVQGGEVALRQDVLVDVDAVCHGGQSARCAPVMSAARSSGRRNDGGGGGPQAYSPRAPSRSSGVHSWSSTCHEVWCRNDTGAARTRMLWWSTEQRRNAPAPLM